jgi:hypothetical protein
MPALQEPEDWARAGAVPTTANATSASATEPYLLALKLFFMTPLLLPIIARGLGRSGPQLLLRHSSVFRGRAGLVTADTSRLRERLVTGRMLERK